MDKMSDDEKKMFAALFSKTRAAGMGFNNIPADEVVQIRGNEQEMNEKDKEPEEDWEDDRENY